jgi:hypothetical protein
MAVANITYGLEWINNRQLPREMKFSGSFLAITLVLGNERVNETTKFLTCKVCGSNLYSNVPFVFCADEHSHIVISSNIYATIVAYLSNFNLHPFYFDDN